MTTLQDLEKQIKKQTDIYNKAKCIAKKSYDNRQSDMMKTQAEEFIAESVLFSLKSIVEQVKEYEKNRADRYLSCW
jgi:hypothetical protein